MDASSAVSDHNVKGSNAKAVGRVTNVYVWDMDETLILLKSLLNGTYAEAFNGLKDVTKGVEIGKMWEKYILDVCDKSFFYEDIENYNMPFLDALSRYDDRRDLADYDFNQDGFKSPHDEENKRKLAYRHRVIANKYMQKIGLHKAIKELHISVESLLGREEFPRMFSLRDFGQGLPNLLDQETMKHWNELYDLTDEYTDRWLSSARAFLGQCSSREEELTDSLASADGIGNHNDTTSEHINVLVTSGSLIPSLVKCLLFRLDNLITHGNVYSSWEVGKLKCFEWIKDRFKDANVHYCVIGDGWEECEAAQAMRWPFVQIDPRPGSSHRFPGLTHRTLGHYLAVVYGSSDAETDEGKSSSDL